MAGKPLTMAVIYTTRDGMIQCLGSKKWADIVMDTCSEQLVESLAIQEESANEITTRAGLLRLPKPVSQLNSKTLQNIIPMAMKNLQGGGYIKWGHQSAKPEWWPVDVVFANVKQRPAEQSDGMYNYFSLTNYFITTLLLLSVRIMPTSSLLC